MKESQVKIQEKAAEVTLTSIELKELADQVQALADSGKANWAHIGSVSHALGLMTEAQRVLTHLVN